MHQTAKFLNDGVEFARAAASFGSTDAVATPVYSGGFNRLDPSPMPKTYGGIFEKYCRRLAAEAGVEIEIIERGEWIGLEE